MIITEVEIDFVKPNGGLVGFASFIVDGCLYLSSVAIYRTLEGDRYRLTYPRKNDFDIFHPINRRASKIIEEAVFKRLKEICGE